MKTLVIDKRKDSTALKRLRDEIGKAMKTAEFRKRSVAILEYALNEWELEEVCKSNGAVSEPWVRKIVIESHWADGLIFGKRREFVRYLFRCWGQPSISSGTC